MNTIHRVSYALLGAVLALLANAVLVATTPTRSTLLVPVEEAAAPASPVAKASRGVAKPVEAPRKAVSSRSGTAVPPTKPIGSGHLRPGDRLPVAKAPVAAEATPGTALSASATNTAATATPPPVTAVATSPHVSVQAIEDLGARTLAAVMRDNEEAAARKPTSRKSR